MARATAFAGGLICGLVLGTAIVIGHADDVAAEVAQAANLAHVDPQDLAGAVNTTGLDPFTYLRTTGELAPVRPPPASQPAVSSRVACIIAVESRGNPNARNPSGAAGLGQFLSSTWASTPQGRAGLSVYNPDANRAAIQWMLDHGRAREFDAVTYHGC